MRDNALLTKRPSVLPLAAFASVGLGSLGLWSYGFNLIWMTSLTVLFPSYRWISVWDKFSFGVQEGNCCGWSRKCNYTKHNFVSNFYGSSMAQVVRCSVLTAGVLSLCLGHSMWVSWWTKLSLDRFSWGFSCFPLPQISFHHISTLISFMVGQDPCYSQTFNKGAS